MLKPEGDADDADEAGDGHGQVGQTDVPPGQQEPDHVHQPADAARAEIAMRAVHDLTAKGGEREHPDPPGRPRPGQANDGDAEQHRAQQP